MELAGPLGFVAALRLRGISVPVDASQTFVRALEFVDVASGDDVYWAGRATLIRDPGDLADFDAAFRLYFGEFAAVADVTPPPEPVSVVTDDGDEESSDDTDGGDTDQPQIEVRYSAVETLRHADLATLSDDERAEAHRLIDQLRFSGPRRRSRRRHVGTGPGKRPDLGATFRSALRTDGEAIHQLTTVRGSRLRRVVLLVDVSGSMDVYARALLRFASAAVTARRGRVEVFALGTRLTRLTRNLDHHDPDRALASATDTIADYGGGTRLGHAIADFNNTWGVRGMARGATVVILSDGWDRGEPDHLGEQMLRVRRVAHEVVWVNPLKASPGYQPLAAGMAASLPHVDAFVDGHSVAALSDLAEVIVSDPSALRTSRSLPAGSPVGSDHA